MRRGCRTDRGQQSYGVSAPRVAHEPGKGQFVSTLGPASADHENGPADLQGCGLPDVRGLPFSDLLRTEDSALSNALRRLLDADGSSGAYTGFSNRAAD